MKGTERDVDGKERGGKKYSKRRDSKEEDEQ
jgi:hypothetical protein